MPVNIAASGSVVSRWRLKSPRVITYLYFTGMNIGIVTQLPVEYGGWYIMARVLSVPRMRIVHTRYSNDLTTFLYLDSVFISVDKCKSTAFAGLHGAYM